MPLPGVSLIRVLLSMLVEGEALGEGVCFIQGRTPTLNAHTHTALVNTIIHISYATTHTHTHNKVGNIMEHSLSRTYRVRCLLFIIIHHHHYSSESNERLKGTHLSRRLFLRPSGDTPGEGLAGTLLLMGDSPPKDRDRPPSDTQHKQGNYTLNYHLILSHSLILSLSHSLSLSLSLSQETQYLPFPSLPLSIPSTHLSVH